MLLSRKTDGLYQPVYEVAGLPGAVYDVIADEDIYTGDGYLAGQKKDTVVETLTTGEDGTAKRRVVSILAVIVWRNVRRLPAVC